MSARVLFVQPPYVTHVVSPPLGFGYLASFLRLGGHHVSLLDLNLKSLEPGELRARLRAQKPDVVGISMMCTGLAPSREIVALVKDELGVPVVVGGAQVCAMPEDSVRITGADYAVVGEGEHTSGELIEALAAGRPVDGIRGLGFLEGDRFTLNQPRELIEDLDTLPWPAWDLMPPRSYRIAPILSSAKGFPIAPIVTTRGCPFDCTFCAGKTVWGRTHRARSPEAVVDEIEMLKRIYGVREIFMGDDNFNFRNDHAVGVCEELLSRDVSIHWSAPNGVRVDSLTPELLALMKRSGCHLIGLGIESSSSEVLELARKKLDVSMVRRVCEQVDEAGIKAVGFFVLGLPGDTRESVLQTIEFARSLPLKRAWFNIVSPYPGSKIFADYAAQHDLSYLDWEKLDVWGKDVAQVSSIPPDELTRLQKKAALRFYARPGILLDLALSQRPSTVMAFMRSKFFRSMLGR